MKRIGIVTLALGAVLSLGACSAGVADDESPLPRPTVDTPGLHASSPVDDADDDPTPTDTADDDADDVTDLDLDDLDSTEILDLGRAALAPGVTQTLDCASGSVEVTLNGIVVEITGDCDAVTIATRSGNVILARHIGALTVNGHGNTVIATDIDAVTIRGNGNAVSWESGTPTVQDSGYGNVSRPVS